MSGRGAVGAVAPGSTTLELRNETLPRGGYLMRASQPMAGLALALLEPEDMDSFASEGLYDAEMQAGGVLPGRSLRELPEVSGVLISP